MNTIDPGCRVLRPLAEYAWRLPSRRTGKRLNRATLWRWALRGVRGRCLETVQLGGGRMTCDAWVWAFVAKGNNRGARQAAPLPPDYRRIAYALGAKSSHQACQTGRRTQARR